MADSNNNSTLEERDEWLEDDGIGMGLFGRGDLMTQLEEGKSGSELDDYIEDVKAGARVAIDQSISILTPWFFSNMPQFYYQTTPREEKVRDLHAVITGHIFESKQTLQLWNRNRTKTTFLAPGNEERVFQSVADSIANLDVKHGAMFTSNDRLLLISSFWTNNYCRVDMNNEKCVQKLELARSLLADADPAEVEEYLHNLDHDMVVHGTGHRLVRMYKLYQFAKDREDAVTHLIPDYNHEYARLDIAYKKMPISRTMSSLLYLFERYGFQVNRSVMVTVNNHTESPVTILTFIFRHHTGVRVDERFVPFLKLNKAAKSLRWVDSDQYDEFWKSTAKGASPYSLNEINLVRAMAIWNQVFLSKRNPYYYSEERIRKSFVRHDEVLKALVEYFKFRHDPRTRDREEKQEQALPALVALIEEVSDPIARDIFNESLNFLRNILRTNYFFPRKTGLAFRMDPSSLNKEHFQNTPFGFFFMVGRGYRGFQVRYRDTARGGLRIVMPKDASAYEIAFAGLFDEAVGLAYAQQLKNKDIPEGGAKAVVLLNPGADRWTSAIGAVGSILNLITVDPQTGKLDPSIIDYYNKEEYIYVGPDENVTNDLIDAFVGLARSQGYRYANAFMSSKPGAGINHKVYGVTSEGVNVYLENMLQELGINPRKQKFTVKMTGGPDGDVAGNELKILHREYGENARVVAVGDGFGAAYDPNGLAWPELLRLVHESLPISNFQKSFLSDAEGAFVVEANTKETIRLRNGLYAVTDADVFIPAGGRPYAVNGDNWRGFIKPDGTLTMRAIVEGANIFFTDEARERLQEHGVLIFKDSSANKCGVICSSFEINSSLILEPEEFMAIKDTYVSQVIDKLRDKADLEAKILLREFRERGRKVNLVGLSKVLSNVINRVTDLVDAHLHHLSEAEFRSPLNDHIILNYVPKILAEKYRDRILERIPRSYRQAMISADTASRLVYAEGVSFFENLADSDVVKTVELYLEQEQKVLALMDVVSNSGLANKDDINYILQRSGARTLTVRAMAAQ